MKKTLIATLALTVSASAFAWGDREQGALAGLIAGMIFQQQRQAQMAPPPVYYPPQGPVIINPPVYQAPITQPPVIIVPHNGGRTCLQHPYHDQYGRLLGYQLSCH